MVGGLGSLDPCVCVCVPVAHFYGRTLPCLTIGSCLVEDLHKTSIPSLGGHLLARKYRVEESVIHTVRK